MRQPFVLILFAIGAVFLSAAPTRAEEAFVTRPQVEKRVIVPVTKLPGNYIGCVLVPTLSTRALMGYRKVHAVACVEATTGEVIVAVLRKNGTLVCSGHGYVDPLNTACATVNVCGTTDYYCL